MGGGGGTSSPEASGAGVDPEGGGGGSDGGGSGGGPPSISTSILSVSTRAGTPAHAAHLVKIWISADGSGASGRSGKTVRRDLGVAVVAPGAVAAVGLPRKRWP